MSRRWRALGCLGCLVASTALAAGRGRYGGALHVTVAQPAGEADPSLADAPAEAAVGALDADTPCRWASASAVAEKTVRLALHPNATVDVVAWAERWRRLRAGSSPYRALLLPVERFEPKPEARALELTLSFPFPDLVPQLCHPALRPALPAEGASPFQRKDRLLTADVGFAGGRPYVDRLQLVTKERATARLLQRRETHVLLGGVGASSGPAVYATYLLFRPDRLPKDFRAQLSAAVDRASLTHAFVRAPSGVPMSGLLPPALGGADAEPPAAAPARGPTQSARLCLDRSNVDQRRVAERLQLKLAERGVRVELERLSREVLRDAARRPECALRLESVLLPPSPVGALALVLELSGRPEQALAELQRLGAIADPAAREAAARERLVALSNELELIGLYAQGTRMEVGPGVEPPGFDAFGVPRLDDAFFLTGLPGP